MDVIAPPDPSATPPGDRPTPSAWAVADRSIRSLDVGPAMVELLVEVSLAEGESAWAKPALVSFYRDEGDAEVAERFFAELKELTLAAQSVAVERRYAPWARTNAISDLPATTLEPAEPSPTPSVWLARWTGVAQRLAPTWEKVHPFLLDLADEAPVVPAEDATRSPSEEAGGLASFVGMLDALIEAGPAAIVIGHDPAPPAADDPAHFLGVHVASVPRGPVEWAMRGRRLEFPDGTCLEFLRYPRLAEGSAGPNGRITLSLDDDGRRLPPSWAALFGAYLHAAAPELDRVADEFARRCARASARLRERFAPELVRRSLVSGGPSRGG